MPNGASNEKMPAMKMTPRRPSKSFNGSEIHPALTAACVRQEMVLSRGTNWGTEAWLRLQETNGNVRHSVDEADDPAIFGTIALAGYRSA